MFFNTTFSRFFLVLASENEAKIEFFGTFFENVDFVKIVLPPRRRAYFQGSEPPKTDPKSMPKRARKKHCQKTSQKSILASILASQNVPKSTQHRKKTKKMVSRKKLQKKESKRAQLGLNLGGSSSFVYSDLDPFPSSPPPRATLHQLPSVQAALSVNAHAVFARACELKSLMRCSAAAAST